MMQINDQLIDYLEELSRLTLTGEEREETKEQLGRVLRYIDKLGELDTTEAEALSHPFPFTNFFREDEAVPCADRESILQNAPRQKDGCFQAPKTVE